VVVTQAQFVVFSSRSLFAEGMAARLRQHLGEHDLVQIDARQPNALQQVIAAEPVAVILDASDEEVNQLAPLSVLLNALPALHIVRLDPQRDEIQVVTSKRREAGQAQDLIDILKSLG
jgi:hypothetical protein